MGMPTLRTCGVNPCAPAPNPDPARWEILSVTGYKHGYILVVRYLDCTNFGGLKILVFRGKWEGKPELLDPHFSESSDSPVARFKPDCYGLAAASKFASELDA